MAARPCLLVVADYPYVTVGDRTYAAIPWDETSARPFLGAFSMILLLGRVGEGQVPPAGWFEVDRRFYEVIDGGSWGGPLSFLANLPRLLGAIRRQWSRVSVAYLKLFYVNSLVVWLYNRMAGKGRRPVATLLVGDSAAALLVRPDILRFAWMRRAGAALVTGILKTVNRRVDLAGFVAEFLRRQFGAPKGQSIVANESWLAASLIQRHGREVPRQPSTILFAGRLVQLKRVNKLVDAVAVLRAGGQDVRCVIVGDGPERGRLERQASDLGLGGHVTFTGWLPLLGREMLAAYDGADVFCLPSFSEGLPLVLIEAMARGVAVVATAVSGIPELVTHGESGLLVPRDDAKALVEALGRMLTEKGLWKRCIDGGYSVSAIHTLESQRGRLARAIISLAG